jgi:penicillin-binding protein 1A
MSSAKKRPAGSRRPWWKRWWVGLLVVPLVLVAAMGLLLFFLVFSRVPLPDDIAAQTSIVYDVNGDEVSGLAAELSREDRDLQEIPEHVREAVMGAEDRGFYDHRGISARGIARALFTNVRAGDIEQGGSTVTQQYVKNAEAGTEQTYTRKVREAALSIKLEQAYSKDEILEFYLNTVYWGRGAYGIEAAAQAYFDVPVEDLDVNEAATLAGMLAAPEAMDPTENPNRADQRRRYTLAGMHEAGWLTATERDELIDAGLPEVTERQRLDHGPNSWYLDAVRWELSRISELDDGELFRGLAIHTELDPRLQELAQEAATKAVAEGPTDSAAIVSVHPDSGGVRALVGGPDITQNEYNVALRAARQSGSTFKAFTLQAYLEAGHSPERRFPAPAQLEVDDYTANNYGGSAYGEQSVRQATATSTNTVYVQMQEEVGREQVIDASRRAGLPVDTSEAVYPTTNRPRDWRVEPFASLTLGSREYSPLELASAFGTYAAEGLHVTPHLITRVESPDGTVLWEPRIREERDVPLNVSRAVTDVLRGVVQSGTGTAADIGRPSAGKTGTTTNQRDAWYVGYVPQLSTAVWLGNLDEEEEIEGTATGGGLAAPVWGEYMRAAVEPWDVVDFVAPDLDEFDGAPPQTASCPEGYSFREPPDGVDDDGWFPDVLVDITDEQGRPCVEDPPPAPECPEGFAFADPPDDDADPRPEVLADITDEDGRPCVEVAPEPDEDPEDEPDDEPEDEDQPDVPWEGEEEPEPDDGDDTDNPDDGDDGGDVDDGDDEDNPDDGDDGGDDDDGEVDAGSEGEDDGD